MTTRHPAMHAARLDQAWEPGLLCRMGGAANGGSAKSPEERERLDEEHQGKDLDKSTGTDPRDGGTASPGTKTSDDPASSRQRSD